MSITLGTTSVGLKSLAVVVALVLLVGCGSDRSVFEPMPVHAPDSILGVWGGEGVQMMIEPNKAVIQYDCGEGTIDVAIVPGEDGRFEAEGTFTSGGGPDPIAGRPKQAAFYSGTILGDFMELTVNVIDTAQSLGSFDLRLGDNGRLVRCY